MATGRISLSIDSPLRTMLIGARSAPAEVQKQIAAHTKSEGQPIFFDEVRGRGVTKLQQKVLVDSARVGVTQRNVFLRSGSVGSLRSGTPVSRLASPAEFGMAAEKKIATRSRGGTSYSRRAGSAFLSPRRGGYVFWPAVAASILRITSLWVQTGVRTLLDKMEGK